MRIGFYTVILLALFYALFAGRSHQTTLAGSTESSAPAPEVKIDNFTFTPATLTVAAGSQVTWSNRDDIPHNVTSDDKSFKSKTLDTDEKFSFTFSKPGTYSYFCSIHPKMTGRIVVQ